MQDMTALAPEPYLGSWVSVMVRVGIVLLNLVGIFSSDSSFGHLAAHARVELSHLAPLSHLVTQRVQVMRRLRRSSS